MNINRAFRKISIDFLRFLSFVISVILGLFFNCDKIFPSPEYGMPHADLRVSGTVRSYERNLPVRGLLVNCRDFDVSSSINSSTMTDSLGKYSLSFTNVSNSSKWTLIVKDIDSSENGEFNTKDTVISTDESDFKGGDGKWYQGRAEVNVDIKVDKAD